MAPGPHMCRRRPAPGREPGHDWSIYRADVTGDIAPGQGESQQVGWRTPGELAALADRTLAHARGDITAAQFAAEPGLEPVWVRWYAQLGVLDLADTDLTLVQQLYR